MVYLALLHACSIIHYFQKCFFLYFCDYHKCFVVTCSGFGSAPRQRIAQESAPDPGVSGPQPQQGAVSGSGRGRWGTEDGVLLFGPQLRRVGIGKDWGRAGDWALYAALVCLYLSRNTVLPSLIRLSRVLQ
jgi:hypothetical protein